MTVISPASLSKGPQLHTEACIALIVSHYSNEIINIIVHSVYNWKSGNYRNYVLITLEILTFLATVVINSCYKFCEDSEKRVVSEYIMYNLVIFTGIFRLINKVEKKTELVLWNIPELEEA
jgi:hypothetical protein